MPESLGASSNWCVACYKKAQVANSSANKEEIQKMCHTSQKAARHVHICHECWPDYQHDLRKRKTKHRISELVLHCNDS